MSSGSESPDSEALAKQSASRFKTRLSKQREKIFLVAFNTRLIEGIYPEQESAGAARNFKESEQRTKMKLVQTVARDFCNWNSAITMRQL